MIRLEGSIARLSWSCVVLLGVALLFLGPGAGCLSVAASDEASTDVEEKADALLRLVAPFRLSELEALKKVDPQEYRRRVTNYADRMRQLNDLQRSDPARYELRLDEMTLEQKGNYLGEQYRKAKSPEEKERLRSELALLLDRLFDIRGQNKAAEIRDLEVEIDRLKEALAERQKSKRDIVRARIEELLGEKATPDW